MAKVLEKNMNFDQFIHYFDLDIHLQKFENAIKN